MATLKFCGAAGTVTGSCSHIQSEAGTFMVDCGLFQGNRTTQELNLGEFPFDPSKVEFLILTHAHIDHSGLLPKLTKAGFSGPIYTTPATKDLLEVMLRDSAYIQESNADRQNRKNERRGDPAVEPIYTIQDAEKTLQQVKGYDYETWFEPKPGIRTRFWNAGHLLGSLSAEIQVDEKGKTLRLLFSGDLGPEEKAFHPEPDAPSGYDYIICESTYGDRDRVDYTLKERRDAMKVELNRALEKGGNVVIPSFAVERSQELLHDIAVLLNSGEIPNATVFLDSPLARKATEVFIKYAGEMEDIEIEPSKLFRHKNFRLVESVEESKAINDVKKGAIIISASGMCTAGRIKHHLKNNIYRPESTILFVGYQSPGTLGHIITSGAKQVRIHGKEYQVRADIRRLGNYSAHADQPELVQWLVERGPVTGGLFLNHGEDDSRSVLADLVAQNGYSRDKIYLPQFDESFELVAGEPPVSVSRPEPRIDPTQLQRDWHNDYAAFILELSNKLQATSTPHDRQELIRRLAQLLK
ncbi:Ribonuclease [Rubripirellula lacrimiformis]|uniref:Ribonuclease n=1 Tax=Rubripirellula lacrimiformis TaxID=1930273 RepID=A0A517NH28_9BACT|nr:MBL fold metallo-hydrolase [Rubripirellula lacrimiformis]QDT06440.1 Ribonuclease [Rubripirellula lacrimiformis]